MPGGGDARIGGQVTGPAGEWEPDRPTNLLSCRSPVVALAMLGGALASALEDGSILSIESPDGKPTKVKSLARFK